MMTEMNLHHGCLIRSTQAEKAKDCDYDDYQADDIDDVVHAKPPFDGDMPVRWRQNPKAG